MIRINLLPPEILERRKYERFYPIVFVLAAALTAAVLIAWGVLRFAVSQSEAELQTIEQSASDLLAQAEGLKVFELKEQELAARQAVASQALAGRVDMGRLAEEVSLVLPEEVWLSRLEADEVQGFTASMYAPEPLGRSAMVGYKSAASALVRLSSLDTLSDVWLGQASVTTFEAYQGLTMESPQVQALLFDVSAKVNPGSLASAEQ